MVVTRQQNTEGNPSRPIRTVHNQHTPTGNTRQPEPQLKVPRVHPLSRATTQGKSFQATTHRMPCAYPLSWATTHKKPARSPLRYPRRMLAHAFLVPPPISLISHNHMHLKYIILPSFVNVQTFA